MNTHPLLAYAEHNWLYLHLPVMIVVISLVYSGTRYDRWDAIFREAFRWGLRMGLFLLGIVLILTGLSMDGSPMALRSVVGGAGAVLEVSLLFLK
jgi:hypothetical protein